MAISERRKRRVYRIAMTVGAVLLIAGIGLVAVASQPASADVAVQDLSIPDANETAGGNVTDVRVSVNLDTEWTVPDATRRVVRLKAGPADGQTELLTYDQAEVSGSGTGSVTLTGSLLDHSAYSAADFNPQTAGTVTEDIVVVAELEVRRESGDPVTASVTEPVTITINDDGTLSAAIGGSGSIEIVTDG